MPALRKQVGGAHARPAMGLTWLRPANIVGSLRIAVAWTHAGGPSWASATRSLPSTRATAPSYDGHVSTKRTGSHSIGDSIAFSSVQSGSWRWA